MRCRRDTGRVGKNMEESRDIKIEDLFGEIEEITEKMEEADTSLEDSFRLYQDGILKLKQAREKIEDIETRVRMLNEEGEEE